MTDKNSPVKTPCLVQEDSTAPASVQECYIWCSDIPLSLFSTVTKPFVGSLRLKTSFFLSSAIRIIADLDRMPLYLYTMYLDRMPLYLYTMYHVLKAKQTPRLYLYDLSKPFIEIPSIWKESALMSARYKKKAE
jgi:hypothetical protein